MKEYNSRGAWFCLSIGIAVVYALTGKLCASVSASVANVSWMVYIPAGLSLASALLWGSRVWLAIFCGELAMCLLTGQSLATSAIMAVGNSLEAGLAGWWFHDRIGRRIELDRVREVVQLMAAELLVLQPICTAFGMAALLLTGNMPAHRLGATAGAWYSSDLYAQFLTAPTVMAWLRWPWPAARKHQYVELAALILATFVVAAIGPSRWAGHSISLPVTLILVFPLLGWAATRFVPTVALTAGMVLSLFAFDAAFAGMGAFEGVSVDDRMVALNVFMGVTIGTALFLAAAAANEHRLEAEQDSLIAKLKLASSQVSRLEDFVTFCAWSGRVRWRDEWVSVETFLSDRYNLNISHGISDDAMRRILEDAGIPLPIRLIHETPGGAKA